MGMWRPRNVRGCSRKGAVRDRELQKREAGEVPSNVRIANSVKHCDKPTGFVEVTSRRRTAGRDEFAVVYSVRTPDPAEVHRQRKVIALPAGGAIPTLDAHAAFEACELPRVPYIGLPYSIEHAEPRPPDLHRRHAQTPRLRRLHRRPGARHRALPVAQDGAAACFSKARRGVGRLYRRPGARHRALPLSLKMGRPLFLEAEAGVRRDGDRQGAGARRSDGS